MAYNKKGYYRRAKVIQEIVRQHYEPERQDRCLAAVWRKHVQPVFGICYNSFLHYLHTRVPADDGGEKPNAAQLSIFGD